MIVNGGLSQGLSIRIQVVSHCVYKEPVFSLNTNRLFRVDFLFVHAWMDVY